MPQFNLRFIDTIDWFSMNCHCYGGGSRKYHTCMLAKVYVKRYNKALIVQISKYYKKCYILICILAGYNRSDAFGTSPGGCRNRRLLQFDGGKF